MPKWDSHAQKFIESPDTPRYPIDPPCSYCRFIGIHGKYDVYICRVAEYIIWRAPNDNDVPYSSIQEVLSYMPGREDEIKQDYLWVMQKMVQWLICDGKIKIMMYTEEFPDGVLRL